MFPYYPAQCSSVILPFLCEWDNLQVWHFAHVAARGAPLNRIHLIYLSLYGGFHFGLASMRSVHSDDEIYMLGMPALRTTHHLQTDLSNQTSHLSETL